MGVDVQDVATLGVERAVTTVPERSVLVLRVIAEDVLAEQRLAVARHGEHVVQVDATADNGKRVAGEVRVGHRVDEKIGLAVLVCANELGQGAAGPHGQVDLVLAQTGDALVDEGLGVLDGVHVLLDGGTSLLALEAGLVEPLLRELLAGTGRVESLGNELLDVENLDALLAEQLRKLVVLGLCDLQEGNVVEQKALKVVRGEVQELLAGAVKANLLQGTDLAVDVESVSHVLPLLSRRVNPTNEMNKTLQSLLATKPAS